MPWTYYARDGIRTTEWILGRFDGDEPLFCALDQSQEPEFFRQILHTTPALYNGKPVQEGDIVQFVQNESIHLGVAHFSSELASWCLRVNGGWPVLLTGWQQNLIVCGSIYRNLDEYQNQLSDADQWKAKVEQLNQLVFPEPKAMARRLHSLPAFVSLSVSGIPTPVRQTEDTEKLRSELARLREERNSAQEQAGQTDVQKRQADAEIETLKADLEVRHHQICDLQKENERLKADLQEKEHLIQTRLEESGSQTQKTNDEISALQGDLEACRKQMAELQRKNEHLKAELRGKEQALKEQTAQTQKQISQNQQTEAEIRTLKADLDARQTQLEDIQKKNQQTEADLIRARQKIRRQDEWIKMQGERLNSLKETPEPSRKPHHPHTEDPQKLALRCLSQEHMTENLAARHTVLSPLPLFRPVLLQDLSVKRTLLEMASVKTDAETETSPCPLTPNRRICTEKDVQSVSDQSLLPSSASPVEADLAASSPKEEASIKTPEPEQIPVQKKDAGTHKEDNPTDKQEKKTVRKKEPSDNIQLKSTSPKPCLQKSEKSSSGKKEPMQKEKAENPVRKDPPQTDIFKKDSRKDSEGGQEANLSPRPALQSKKPDKQSSSSTNIPVSNPIASSDRKENVATKEEAAPDKDTVDSAPAVSSPIRPHTRKASPKADTASSGEKTTNPETPASIFDTCIHIAFAPLYPEKTSDRTAKAMQSAAREAQSVKPQRRTVADKEQTEVTSVSPQTVRSDRSQASVEDSASQAEKKPEPETNKTVSETKPEKKANCEKKESPLTGTVKSAALEGKEAPVLKKSTPPLKPVSSKPAPETSKQAANTSEARQTAKTNTDVCPKTSKPSTVLKKQCQDCGLPAHSRPYSIITVACEPCEEDDQLFVAVGLAVDPEGYVTSLASSALSCRQVALKVLSELMGRLPDGVRVGIQQRDPLLREMLNGNADLLKRTSMSQWQEKDDQMPAGQSGKADMDAAIKDMKQVLRTHSIRHLNPGDFEANAYLNACEQMLRWSKEDIVRGHVQTKGSDPL